MKHLILVIVFSFFIFHFLFCHTHLVPDDYTTIQSAIDVSDDVGDTIIVSPGTYVENIDYNGKNIYLTSYYFYTENDSSIHNTIIDGNQNGSVVTFYGGETGDAVLNGFTITNGSGRYIGGSITHGGGFYIRDSSPSILNCYVVNNFVGGCGGGLYFRDSYSYISNITVTENYSDYRCAAGISFTRANVEMDSVNRCNVFLNEAAENNDLRCTFEYEPCPTIYLDTATVNIIDDYFIAGNFEVVDILNGKLDKVADDLYVSPDGNNNNSGLTAEEPLKNITYALHMIDADSLNPRVIHLLPGIYSPSGGQHFPLNLRSYVSLIGAGMENSIIDLEQVESYAMMGANYEKEVTLSSFSLKNGFVVYDEDMSAITLKFYHNSGLIIDSLLFENIFARNIINPTMTTSYMVYPDYTSTTIRNCEFRNNTVLQATALGWNTHILVQNCKFDSNLPVESFENDWVDGSHTSITLGGHHYTYELPYSRSIENCIINNNINDHSGAVGMQTIVLAVTPINYPLNIINCTFANNSSNFYGISIASDDLHHTEARFVNCILWNDDIPYEIHVPEDYFEGQEMVYLNMAYNDVQNGTDKFLFDGAVDLTYEDSNIDAEPLFVDPENGDYTLQPDSPLIDAGTALYIVDGDTVVNLLPDQYYGDAPDMGAYEWNPDMSIESDSPLFPESVVINSVYPNPFNSSTTIKYQLSQSGKIRLSLYDIKGRLIRSLINAYVGAGEHQLSVDMGGFASGSYILKLKTDKGRVSKKITAVN